MPKLSIPGEQTISKLLISLALLTFLISLALFGFDRIWPNIIADRFVPHTLLSCVAPGIVMLLLYELYTLVRSTDGSFIGFIHAQFEVISLIILRDLFKKLDKLSTDPTHDLLVEVAIVAVGSIVLYFFVEVLERIRHNLTFAAYEEGQLKSYRWITAGKRLVRRILGVYFFALVIYEGIGWFMGRPGAGFNTEFLTLVFGGLIVYNVLMLFTVLLVSSSYETLFEHSALVLASSVVLVALKQEAIVAVPLICCALLFVIATLLLHGFTRGASLKTLMAVAASTVDKSQIPKK